jgi:hypothetical protein
MSKDSWTPRGPPKGRGKGKGNKGKGDGFGNIKRINSEDREKRQGGMMLKGRGRGSREKVGTEWDTVKAIGHCYEQFSHRSLEDHQLPSLLKFSPATKDNADWPTTNTQRGRGGPISSGAQQRNKANADWSTTSNTQHDAKRPETRDLLMPDHSANETRRDPFFRVRGPVTAVVENAEHQSHLGFSVRVPAVTERDSPQKFARTNQSSSSPSGYSQRVREMSDVETNHEVQWQEWRIEEGARKVGTKTNMTIAGTFSLWPELCRL